MRRVAGRLKLDLASYREYKAFAQFASDLDEATRNILRRGDRMTEVLKQRQYDPMSPTDQVIAIFAGTQGHWDDIRVDAITHLESQLLEYIHEACPDVVKRMQETKELSDEDAETLNSAIEDFKDELDERFFVDETAGAQCPIEELVGQE
jgi:F-type H+-transporting ATPase subunit alpha